MWYKGDRLTLTLILRSNFDADSDMEYGFPHYAVELLPLCRSQHRLFKVF